MYITVTYIPELVSALAVTPPGPAAVLVCTKKKSTPRHKKKFFLTPLFDSSAKKKRRGNWKFPLRFLSLCGVGTFHCAEKNFTRPAPQDGGTSEFLRQTEFSQEDGARFTQVGSTTRPALRAPAGTRSTPSPSHTKPSLACRPIQPPSSARCTRVHIACPPPSPCTRVHIACHRMAVSV